MMEIKKWNEYLSCDKERILMNLFAYFGKSFFSLQELDEYKKLIRTNPDDIFDIYIAAYLCNENGQTVIINSLKEKSTDNITILLNKMMQQDPNIVEEARNIFIEENVKSINYPEPRNPMPIDAVFNQIKKMF